MSSRAGAVPRPCTSGVGAVWATDGTTNAGSRGSWASFSIDEGADEHDIGIPRQLAVCFLGGGVILAQRRISTNRNGGSHRALPAGQGHIEMHARQGPGEDGEGCQYKYTEERFGKRHVRNDHLRLPEDAVKLGRVRWEAIA